MCVSKMYFSNLPYIFNCLKTSFTLILQVTVKEALAMLDDANSAEEVIKAAHQFVVSSQNEESGMGPSETSIISELQTLLLKKTANNLPLLNSLLTVHILDLMNVLQQVATSHTSVEASLEHLVAKLISLTSSHDDSSKLKKKSEIITNMVSHFNTKVSDKLKITIDDIKKENSWLLTPLKPINKHRGAQKRMIDSAKDSKNSKDEL